MKVYSGRLLQTHGLFVACQAALSMGFSRQEYWIGLPLPPPGDLPEPGIEPTSPVSPALAGQLFTTESPVKPLLCDLDSHISHKYKMRLGRKVL